MATQQLVSVLLGLSREDDAFMTDGGETEEEREEDEEGGDFAKDCHPPKSHIVPSMNASSAPTSSSSSSIAALDPIGMIQVQRCRTREYTDAELEEWIRAYYLGRIPDYQMAAWLMAVCCKGLSSRETATLTRCMADSGERIDWATTAAANQIGKSMVDVHSTGGVGDKVSIILVPLVASLGVTVPMMAGRGLGLTGGTIDKLDSIPGFRTNLSINEFTNIVQSVGCAIAATGPKICPVDSKLYALRDATGTVSSVPLQTASIMSKKIAEHPSSLVLDVKYGRGAFQATVSEAEELAVSLVGAGHAHGLDPTTAFLTRMDHPIGRAVGNWVEVLECIHIMDPSNWVTTSSSSHPLRLSQDLIILVITQAAQIMLQSDLFPGLSYPELMDKAYAALRRGDARNKFMAMVSAQNGAANVVREPALFSSTLRRHRIVLHASQAGYIVDMNAHAIGQAAVLLGAGRQTINDLIDSSAGIWFHVQVGDYVNQDDNVAEVYSNRSADVTHLAIQKIQNSIVYSSNVDDVKREPVVTHVVTAAGVESVVLPSWLSTITTNKDQK